MTTGERGMSLAALFDLSSCKRLDLQLLGHGLLDLIAEIGGDQGGGIDIQGLIQRGQNAQAHQCGDHLAGLDTHAFGQVADADGGHHLDPFLDGLGLRNLDCLPDPGGSRPSFSCPCADA